MTPIPHKNTFADTTGMAVLYIGENVLKQFCFGNGSQLITHVFGTLPEAIERFGKRIAVYGKEFNFSAPYQSGILAAHAGNPYAPVREHGRQAVLEYGAGYIRGLLEKPEIEAQRAIRAVMVTMPPPTPAPTQAPLPVQPFTASDATPPTKETMLAGIARIAAKPTVLEPPAPPPPEPAPVKRRGRPRKVVAPTENLDE